MRQNWSLINPIYITLFHIPSKGFLQVLLSVHDEKKRGITFFGLLTGRKNSLRQPISQSVTFIWSIYGYFPHGKLINRVLESLMTNPNQIE